MKVERIHKFTFHLHLMLSNEKNNIFILIYYLIIFVSLNNS